MEQQLLTAEELPEGVTETGLPPVYTEQNAPAQLQCSESLPQSISQHPPQPVYYKSVPVIVHINDSTAVPQTHGVISASFVGGKTFSTKVAKIIDGIIIVLAIITLVCATIASSCLAERYGLGAGFWYAVIGLQIAANAVLVAMGVFEFGLSGVMMYISAGTVLNCTLQCIQCTFSLAKNSLINFGADVTAAGQTPVSATVQMQEVKMGVPEDKPHPQVLPCGSCSTHAPLPQVHMSCGSCSVTPCQAVNPVLLIPPCTSRNQCGAFINQRVCSHCQSCSAPHQLQ